MKPQPVFGPNLCSKVVMVTAVTGTVMMTLIKDFDGQKVVSIWLCQVFCLVDVSLFSYVL